MKKFRGKALAALLSLALVASSFPVTLASARTKHADGVLTKDPDQDEFWLVNGVSRSDSTIENFQDIIFENGVPLETADHHEVDDPEVYSVSRVSGDNLTSWEIGDDDDDDMAEGQLDLSLRKSDSEGDEVLAILYKGTYTDDDDNDVEVRASTRIEIHAVDEYSTVIGTGDIDNDGYLIDDGVVLTGTDTPELDGDDDDDDNFALKTTNGAADSKTISVFRAERANDDHNTEEKDIDESNSNGCLAQWKALPTVIEDEDEDDILDNSTNVAYVLEPSNHSDIECSNTSTTTGAVAAVTAEVSDDNPSTANVTFKAKCTDYYHENELVDDDDDIKTKVKVEKKVLVNDTASQSYQIKKEDHDTVITGSGVTGDIGTHTVKIDGGYIVKFVDRGSSTVNVNNDASIDCIKGKVQELNIGDAKKVESVDLDAGDVNVKDSDAKVGDISTDDDATVDISADNDVGNIDVDDDDTNGGGKVTMSAGSAKAITTKGTVELTGSEDDTPISVESISAKDIDLDSSDGAISVNKLIADAPTDDDNGGEFTFKGDETTVKAIDFAGFDVDLSFDDYQGEIPAPENATADDTLIETTDPDDDVTVKGDLDVYGLTIEDESQMTFDGALNVSELDGSGTMFIGANKLYIDEDATGVVVKLTDSFNSGDTLFTAASDCVDDDDLEFFGTTVKKDEGKTTDKFVADTLEFAGLTLNKTSDKIVLGDSETFTASAFAPGTSLPDGYSIEFDMDDNSGVFEMTDNGNGTATVKVVDYDDVFSDENKATLIAYLVDEDGDEDDDYEEAECKLTALKVPEVTFTSDTTSDFTLAPGASYQFKITATAVPTMTAGTAGVLDVTNVGRSGNDYFIKVTASADAAGKETGIYVNDTKLLVVKVAGSDDFTSDTTADFSIAQGSSYQYKITATSAPSFTLGTSGVYNYTLVSQSGNDYFYQITAVGASGAQTGVYVNGTLVNVVTVA